MRKNRMDKESATSYPPPTMPGALTCEAKSCEGAPAAATHAPEEALPSAWRRVLLMQTWTHGVHEEHQPQLGCVDLVVVFHVLLDHLHHLGQGGEMGTAGSLPVPVCPVPRQGAYPPFPGSSAHGGMLGLQMPGE